MNDKNFQLLDVKYFKKMQQAIWDNGKVNIQLLAAKFNIKTGNTYFRNFVNDKGQEYLGPTSLNSIMDACGYDLKIIPVKRNDELVSKEIEDLTEAAFEDISNIISQFAYESKKNEIQKKKKPKNAIANASMIAQALFDTGDDDDDDELLTGYN